MRLARALRQTSEGASLYRKTLGYTQNLEVQVKVIHYPWICKIPTFFAGYRCIFKGNTKI